MGELEEGSCRPSRSVSGKEERTGQSWDVGKYIGKGVNVWSALHSESKPQKTVHVLIVCIILYHRSLLPMLPFILSVITYSEANPTQCISEYPPFLYCIHLSFHLPARLQLLWKREEHSVLFLF